MLRRERERKKKVCRRGGRGNKGAFLEGNFSRDSNRKDYSGVAFKGDAESK